MRPTSSTHNHDIAATGPAQDRARTGLGSAQDRAQAATGLAQDRARTGLGSAQDRAQAATGLAQRGTGPDARGLSFEQLYRESYRSVYGWVRARMACDADAEDVVAEAYLRAARSFDAYDPARARFGTWVTTIAHNCMVSHLRRERAHAPLDEVPESVLATRDERAGVDPDDLELLKRLLACLDARERELVALKYREGLRNVDIAARLGMNPSTVATKLARALAKMRVRWEEWT